MTSLPSLADVDSAIQSTINNQSTSYWLRHALTLMPERDAVDALYDARTLLFLLEERMSAIERTYQVQP